VQENVSTEIDDDLVDDPGRVVYGCQWGSYSLWATGAMTVACIDGAFAGIIRRPNIEVSVSHHDPTTHDRIGSMRVRGFWLCPEHLLASCVRADRAHIAMEAARDKCGQELR